MAVKSDDWASAANKCGLTTPAALEHLVSVMQTIIAVSDQQTAIRCAEEEWSRATIAHEETLVKLRAELTRLERIRDGVA